MRGRSSSSRAVTASPRLIEARRAQSIAAPQHENEAHDAPPDLLRALWLDVYRVGVRWDWRRRPASDAPYSPAVYQAVYRHLLRHRQTRVIAHRRAAAADRLGLRSGGAAAHLQATAAQAESILADWKRR